jgi:hypothetical protein
VLFTSQTTMVNRKIGPDLKECALRLWELGWEKDIIFESLGVSRASVYQWQSIFAEHNSVLKPCLPLVGWPCIIIRAVMTAIKEVYNNEADVYLDELTWWLAIHHNIVISCSGLQENLINVGLTWKLLHKIGSEQDEVIQAEFLETVREHSAGQGDKFVFLNKMSMNDHGTSRHYGQSMVGECADFVDNFVCGDQYSLLAAVAKKGYVASQTVLGSFDSVEFYNFVAEQVVSTIARVLCIY